MRSIVPSDAQVLFSTPVQAAEASLRGHSLHTDKDGFQERPHLFSQMSRGCGQKKVRQSPMTIRSHRRGLLSGEGGLCTTPGRGRGNCQVWDFRLVGFGKCQVAVLRLTLVCTTVPCGSTWVASFVRVTFPPERYWRRRPPDSSLLISILMAAAGCLNPYG